VTSWHFPGFSAKCSIFGKLTVCTAGQFTADMPHQLPIGIMSVYGLILDFEKSSDKAMSR
jgi:hypothetical protein